MRRAARSISLILPFVPLFAGTGCTSEEERVGARFALPADPTAAIPFDQIPYPNDMVRAPDGHIHVEDDTIPLSAQADEIARANIVDALTEQTCFGVTSGIVFAIGGVEASDLLDESTATDSAARIVDLETGVGLPAELHYRPLERELFVRPLRGTVLAPSSRHAAYITTDLAMLSAGHLEPAPDLTSVLGSSDDVPARLDRAAQVYAPLREYLAAEGIDPSAVAGATVFTTCDHGADFRAVQAQLDDSAPVSATIERVMPSGAELDDFLGVPDDNTFPGLDNPGGIAHASIAYVVLGSFPSPNYQSATPKLLGAWAHDESGAPVPKGTDVVPFLLVLPHADSYADTPVVVFQHGLGASRVQVLEVANSLAARGFAVIGIDIPFHGARFPDAVDHRHNVTDASGPDGLADSTGPSAAMVFFDLVGDEQVDWLDPLVMRSSFMQAAVDMMVLARLVDGGDWSELRTIEGLSDLSFRGDRIVFAAESFGSIIGATATAYEPRYGAAFLAVSGGNLLGDLLENSPVYGGLFLPILGGAFDISPGEIDPTYDPAHTHRAFQLIGPLLDAGDPIAHAPQLLAKGAHVVMANAYADESLPNQASQALASAIGLDWLELDRSSPGPVYVPTLAEIAAPVCANADGITAVAFEIDPATHGMLTRRWGTRHYRAGFPPAEPLPETLEVDNPIVELQRMLGDFAETYIETGVPVLADPFAAED